MIPPELVKLLAVSVRGVLIRWRLDGEALIPNVEGCINILRFDAEEWERFHAWRWALGISQKRRT